MRQHKACHLRYGTNRLLELAPVQGVISRALLRSIES